MPKRVSKATQSFLIRRENDWSVKEHLESQAVQIYVVKSNFCEIHADLAARIVDVQGDFDNIQ